VDLHSTINYACADDVVMTLPWFYPYDYLENPFNGISTPMWNVSLTSLSPAKVSIPNSTAGGNITIYARLMPGYVLTVPVMQGKLKDMAHGAATHLAEGGKGKPRGAISSVADTVAGVAKKLEGIPFIGSYAGTISSVAETAGNIAAFFGFSRTGTQFDSKGVAVRGMPNTVASDDNPGVEEV